MTCQVQDGPDRDIRYRSLSSFYLADPRRTGSYERDLGLWWKVGLHGPTYRAAWVRETGELYAERLGIAKEQGEVHVLGRANDEQLEEALEGWADICPQPDSMTWLRHRAMSLARIETPRALSDESRGLVLAGPVLATASEVDTTAAPLSGRHIDGELLARVGTAAAITVPATALLFELSAI
jgi:hypothetical protein